jgi:hypothetical protein
MFFEEQMKNRQERDEGHGKRNERGARKNE